MRIKGSLLILLTVSLGTALAMSAKDKEDVPGGVAGAVAKEARARGVSASVGRQPAEMHFDLSTIKRPIPKKVHTSGLFESKSWYVPPPAPKVIEPVYTPPPQPTAPTLPFTFIGRMRDGNEITVFLSKGDRRYTVKEKDILDDTYRVDKISEGEAVLTYLPMNIQQTLPFNSTGSTSPLISASELKSVMRPDFIRQQSDPND